MLHLILFDLDGTLLDTAPDLALALNIQRDRHGLPPLPQSTIRPYASHGSKGLLSIGFGLTPQHVNFGDMREEYLNIYDQVMTQSPVLFDGMTDLLAALERRNLRWGIVTNKPRRFTVPILKKIGLEEHAACVVCGDDMLRAKPYPDTLLKACDITGVAVENCIYVGDAERDIQAGRAAGMRTVISMYGYIDSTDRPHEWDADFAIHHPAELLTYIDSLQVAD